MSNNYSLIIGLEEYQNTKIKPVKFAENDAMEIQKSLLNLNYEQNNQILLLSSQATKTTIESNMRYFSRMLTPDDYLIIFYAGHGFCLNSHNYITCHDTNPIDLEHTSIKLQSFIDSFKGKCKHLIMFIDSCHSGLEIDESMRGIFSDLNEHELLSFLNDGNYFIGFASSKTDEVSYSISDLKHGAWTYHLLEALNGNASLALENKYLLTSNSLQNYLKLEVPKTIREKLTGRKIQTPWRFGGDSGEYLIANLEPIIKSKQIQTLPLPLVIENLSFLKKSGGNIKSLSGFKKNHRVPDNINSTTRDFVERISEEEIKELSNSFFERIMEAFNYKRKEIKYENSGSKTSIITKDFDVNIYIEQDCDDASCYDQYVILTNIRDNVILKDERFNSAFENVFNLLELEFNKNKSIPDLIDLIQDIDNDNINLKFNPDLTQCNLSIQGIEGTLTIFDNKLHLSFGRNKEPFFMVNQLFNLKKELLTYNNKILLE